MIEGDRALHAACRPRGFSVVEEHRSLALFQSHFSAPSGYCDFAVQDDDSVTVVDWAPQTVVPRRPIAATGVCICTFAPFTLRSDPGRIGTLLG